MRIVRTLILAAISMYLWLCFTGIQCPVVAAGQSVKELCHDAMAAYSSKNFVEAAGLFEKASQQSKLVKPESLELSLILGNLGSVYRDMGKYPESENCFKQAVPMQQKFLGMKSPNYAATLQQFALLLKKTKRSDEANKVDDRINQVFSPTPTPTPNPDIDSQLVIEFERMNHVSYSANIQRLEGYIHNTSNRACRMVRAEFEISLGLTVLNTAEASVNYIAPGQSVRFSTVAYAGDNREAWVSYKLIRLEGEWQ